MLLTRKVILLFALCVVVALGSDTSTVAITNRTGTVVPPEILTNEGLITLADAGFSDAFIVQKILLSDRTRFDVSVEGLANLRRNALSESLVLFLVEHNAQPSIARATAVMPTATPATVRGKFKMKKIAVPVVAADGLNPAIRPSATVSNPVITQPGLNGLYGYSYAPYGYVPYTYPAPVVASSWWR